jgi:DivIVA domain-containing protein
MRQFLLWLIVAAVVAAIAYCVTWIFTGKDDGLADEEPDSRALPLPGTRPLAEGDLDRVRFDTTIRGYRMDQVDAALRRSAYDIGYKTELINVLEAEVAALREGRSADAETLRQARLGALPSLAEPEPAVIELDIETPTEAGDALTKLYEDEDTDEPAASGR